MTQDTEDVVARARAAFEEYGWFLTNNPNAEPKEFLPALKQWADVTLGLMPELLDHAQSLSDRIDVLEGALRLAADRLLLHGHRGSSDDARAALHQEGIGAPVDGSNEPAK